MSNKNLKIFIAVAIFVMIIPFYNILDNATVVSFGKEYKFRIEGIDPYDIVRGRYISVRFKDNIIEGSYEGYEDTNNKYYATIINGADGYAQFDKIFDKKPLQGDYYYTEVFNWSSENNKWGIETPTTYYMNEEKSLSAEGIIRKNRENAYATVRVSGGKMIITGLYVNDKLIDEITE